MIAVRIGPAMRMAVVGAPSYFATRPAPRTPHDLADHAYINLRLPTRGGLYAWEFEKDGRALNVRVEGQAVFNTSPMLLEGALAGLGLAYVLEPRAEAHVAASRLVRVLEDWCPPFAGYHLYYPSRRQLSPAFPKMRIWPPNIRKAPGAELCRRPRLSSPHQDVQDHLFAARPRVQRLPSGGFDRFEAVRQNLSQDAHEAAVGLVARA